MKVLTVGCSFTAGEELPDPATQAWPALLAVTNNWSVTNLGKGGGSNDRNIRIVFEEVNRYDLIVVAWTQPDRFEVPYDNDLLDINVNTARKRNIKWVDEYYSLHYDRLYSYKKWFRQIIMLQSYLKQLEKPYIFCSTFGMWSDLRQELYDEYSVKLVDLIMQVDPRYYVEWPRWGMIDWQGDCPKGPGGHPLELGHKRIAEKINEHIRNLGWLS